MVFYMLKWRTSAPMGERQDALSASQSISEELDK